MSFVHRLYGKYAHPLVRVVKGVPTSWDPAIVAIKCSATIQHAVWSPCSRFIAISFWYEAGIHVLDAATLKRLKSFTPPGDKTQLLAFSPESRLLMWLSGSQADFLSWDLQTGILVSKVPIGGGKSAKDVCSITYSGSGNTFGVLYKGDNDTTISIYDIPFSALVYSHPIKGLVTDVIWTNGDYLQFATLGPRSITIWEVGFNTIHPPMRVKSLPTPSNFVPPKQFVFLPTLFRLAFILEETILVWDAQHSKLLLNSEDVEDPKEMAFSPDGVFFACVTYFQEIYLWKESQTGYTPHRKIMHKDGGNEIPLLSPNGQSIVAPCGDILQLFHTTDSTTSPSSFLAQTIQQNRLVLGFLLDESLAVAAQWLNSVAVVLDLKSGAPWLIIDAGMKIYGLRVAGSTVVVVGNDKISTWNLPTRGCILNVTENTNDGIQTTILYRSAPLETLKRPSVLISPDLKYIAITEELDGNYKDLNIYNVSTGKHLASTTSWGGILWFTPDGHEVWCHWPWGEEGWAIVEDGESDVTRLEGLNSAQGPSGGPPWQPSHGWQVVDNEWILSSNRKKLLWLPHHWQVDLEGIKMGEQLLVWSGRFLALRDPELPEIVILELLGE